MSIEKEKATEGLAALERLLSRRVDMSDMTADQRIAVLTLLMGVLETGFQLIRDQRAGAREPYQGAIDDIIRGSLACILIAKETGLILGE